MRVNSRLMSLKKVAWLMPALFAACGTVDISTDVAVRTINNPPTVESEVVTLDEGDDLDIVLQAEDVEGNILTYTLVTSPRYGTLSGTPPNMNYEAPEYFYGEDSFQFKVTDGEFESEVATVSITVERVQPIFYLSPEGDDFTGTVGDASKPFQTAQAVYEAAVTHQTVDLAGVGFVHVDVESANYTGIVLSANWNSSIIFHSDADSPAELGGIWGNGSGENAATDIGNTGRTISVKGWDINVGNISALGAPSSLGNYTGGPGGSVTLEGPYLVAGAISVNGGGGTDPGTDWAPGNGGSVTINTGVVCGEIYASGGSGGTTSGVAVAQPGNGGTVVVAGTSGAILAEGGYTGTGTGGAGGDITVSGTAGNIWARGGGDVAGSEGSGGAGGEVTVTAVGTVGAIRASGGSAAVAAGAGGEVTMRGNSGLINVDGGSATDITSAAGAAGGLGGTVDVYGTVSGAVSANGGAGGDTSFAAADGGVGGAGGVITLDADSSTEDISAIGGAGGEGDGAGVNGDGGDGGAVTVTLPATYGTVSVAGGTGETAGAAGTLTVN